MSVKFKEALEQLAQGQSRNLVKLFLDSCQKNSHSLSWFMNEKEKFKEAIEQLADAFVVSHCTQQFNINY